MPQINYAAVLVAGIINFIIGSFWYSPMLFGNIWMKMVNITKDSLKKNDPTMPMIMTFVSSFVTAYVLAYFVRYAGVTNFAGGALIGLWSWVGFVAATSISNYMFTGKSMRLFLIDKCYYLVSMLLMGGILSAWI